MTKILFVITQSEMGGAQRYLLEFAPYLARKGHEVVVAAGEGDGTLFEQCQISNVKYQTYFIKHLVRNPHPVKDFFALIAILKIIKKERPDVLFLQSTKAGFIGSLAAKLFMIHDSKFMIHVVYRIGGWSFCDPRPWWMNKILFWMEKISAPWKDLIIVNSECDQKIAVDKKIAPSSKIAKIYNGIDAEKLKFLKKEGARNFILSKLPHIHARTTSPPAPLLRKERGIPPLMKGGRGGVIVGAIANLYATKGIEYLIEAAHILHTQYNIHNTIYIVIGEGKERPKLEKLIKKYNLENNFFLAGRLLNASQYLKAFDVFVLPSVKEGFPWVLLEAMTAEIPIIATSVGAIPEIIEDGKEGLLAVPEDASVISDKIKKLVESPKQAQELAKNATEKLKKFSLSHMLEQSEGTLKIPMTKSQ